MDAEQQDRNIAHLFRLHDTNRNGSVGWDDLEAIVDRLAGAEGEFREGLLAAFRADWRRMSAAADKDEDGRVTLEEWSAYHKAALATDEGYEVAVDGILRLLLAVVDPDGDGRISTSDYMRLGPAFNLRGPSDIALAIEHIDTDADGVLTAAEVHRAVARFFRPEGPDDPGNWLLGPIR